MTHPILRPPRFDRPFLLTTDANKDSVSAILGQLDDDNKEYVVAYHSASLSGSALNWFVGEKEAWAIVSGSRKFRPYLYGSQTTVITDHIALRTINSSLHRPGKLARWAQELSEFSFTYIHRPGRLHQNADAFTRQGHESNISTSVNEQLTIAIDDKTGVIVKSDNRNGKKEDEEEIEINMISENSNSHGSDKNDKTYPTLCSAEEIDNTLMTNIQHIVTTLSLPYQETFIATERLIDNVNISDVQLKEDCLDLNVNGNVTDSLYIESDSQSSNCSEVSNDASEANQPFNDRQWTSDMNDGSSLIVLPINNNTRVISMVEDWNDLHQINPYYRNCSMNSIHDAANMIDPSDHSNAPTELNDCNTSELPILDTTNDGILMVADDELEWRYSDYGSRTEKDYDSHGRWISVYTQNTISDKDDSSTSACKEQDGITYSSESDNNNDICQGNTDDRKPNSTEGRSQRKFTERTDDDTDLNDDGKCDDNDDGDVHVMFDSSSYRVNNMQLGNRLCLPNPVNQLSHMTMPTPTTPQHHIPTFDNRTDVNTNETYQDMYALNGEEVSDHRETDDSQVNGDESDNDNDMDDMYESTDIKDNESTAGWNTENDVQPEHINTDDEEDSVEEGEIYEPDTDNEEDGDDVNISSDEIVLPRLSEGAFSWIQMEQARMVPTQAALKSDGILYNISGKIVVSPTMIPVLLHLAHTQSLAGHVRWRVAYDRLKKHWHWYGMHGTVKRYVRACKECQIFNPRTTGVPQYRSWLGQYELSPFSWIAVDFVGPIAPAARGHKYILTILDLCSKWVIAIPTRTQSTAVVANSLLRHVVTLHGVPERVLSDRGKSFVSAVLADLYSRLGMKRVLTSGYRPQCNGATERVNGTVVRTLSKLVRDKPKLWVDLVDVVTFAYNCTPHSTTGFSPFYLVYGREPRLPLDILAGAPLANTTIEARRLALAHALERVNQINKKRMLLPKVPVYKKGDLVLYKDPNITCTKLQAKWQGPYVITDIVTNVTFKVRPVAGNMRHREVIHAQFLKPFYSPRQAVCA
jgi:transposase InsO family protein